MKSYIIAFIIIIVLNLGVLSNSTEIPDCDQLFPNIHFRLNTCIDAHQLPMDRVLKIKFSRAFLGRYPDIAKQKLLVQSLCNNVRAILECQMQYSISLWAVCPHIDEDRLIEIYSLQLSKTVHHYLCSNNMTNILPIFENDNVRLMYRNRELRMCIENVPNINSIRIMNSQSINNMEFCRSLHSSYKCVRNVFEKTLNPKLITIVEHIYELSRNVVWCGNRTMTNELDIFLNLT